QLFQAETRGIAGEVVVDWRCSRHGADAGSRTGRRSPHKATSGQSYKFPYGRSTQTRIAGRQRRVLRQRDSPIAAAEHYENGRGRGGEDIGRELYGAATLNILTLQGLLCPQFQCLSNDNHMSGTTMLGCAPEVAAQARRSDMQSSCSLLQS